MKRVSWVRVGLLIISVLLPWLTGCSAVRLSYGQGPTLAYWWLDGYLDFTSEQTPRVKAALEDWFAWHRATQVPDYAALLASMQALAVDNITPDQVCRVVDEVQQRASLAFEHAVPAAADIVLRLTPAQVNHLEKRYAKGNAELSKDFLQPDLAERQEASFKRTLERAESMYGPLDAAQRRLLAERLAGSPFDARAWLAERIARQQDILRSLRELQAGRSDAARAEAMLRNFAAHMVLSPRPEARAFQERLNQANCALVARLHNATTTAQRREAVARLKDWEDDLRSLLKP